MINYLELGANVNYQRMTRYAGVKISYKRKGGPILTFVAVPGRVVTEQQDLGGAVTREVTRDFIIERKELSELDPPKPVRGDEITQHFNIGQQRFIVGGEDIGTAPYEEADSYGVAWRVHTKRIQSDA